MQSELGDAQGETSDIQDELVRLESVSAELEQAITVEEGRIEEGESELRACQQVMTAVQVDLAKSEQRLDGLRAQLQQFEETSGNAGRDCRNQHASGPGAASGI